jgi:ribosomal protein S18 acetylase RimI-like enzyme
VALGKLASPIKPAMSTALRPALPEDESLQLEVYASTRADELSLVPWTAEEKLAFVQMQFNAQRQHYMQYYPDAQWLIIMREDLPAGRLIVDRAGAEIVLMDIALLPPYRNQGIGTALIRDLLDEAQHTGRPVRLHVEFFNPAMGLYERLGFTRIGESGVYFEMEWRPVADQVK